MVGLTSTGAIRRPAAARRRSGAMVGRLLPVSAVLVLGCAGAGTWRVTAPAPHMRSASSSGPHPSESTATLIGAASPGGAAMAPLEDRGATIDRRGGDASARASRRLPATGIDAETLTLWQRPHARIASSARGSIAIGTVTGGVLVQGAELPLAGQHHRVLERIAPRNVRFATEELRDLVLCAAKEVAKRHPDAVLGVGNLSRASGGDSPWSVSHNNGRDADLAFYARRLDGSRVVPPHLFDHGRDGVARGGPEPLVFDVATNWALVRGLLDCEGPVRLEFLFIASWLKQPLIAYARATREPDAVVARAAQLLRQPRGAAAHSDHLHVRIGCPSDDLGEGCLHANRAPPGAIGAAEPVQLRLPAIRAALTDGDSARRAGAVALLTLYRDPGAVVGVERLLEDPAPEVRRACWRALATLAPTRLGGHGRILAAEPDPGVVSAAAHAALEAGAHDLLVDLLSSQRRLVGGDTALQPAWLAAVLLGDAGDLAVAPALVTALDSGDRAVAWAARASLERLTNHGTPDVMSAVVDEEPARAWRRFVAALPAGMSRAVLVMQGFAAAGLVTDPAARLEIGSLVRALAAPPPYPENATRLLVDVVRWTPEDGRGARAAPLAFWGPWLKRRRLIDARSVATIDPAWALAGAPVAWLPGPKPASGAARVMP